MKHNACRCKCGRTAVYEYMPGNIAKSYLRIVCPGCGRKTEWTATIRYLRKGRWRTAAEVALYEFEKGMPYEERDALASRGQVQL